MNKFSRRAVLLAVPAIATPSAFRIVDSHTHVWSHDSRFPFADGASPPPEDRTPEMLIELMKQHGVEKAVIIQVRHHLFDNRYLAAVLKAYPQYFRGVARVNPEDPAAPDQLSRLVQEQGFHGLRLNPVAGARGDWIRGPSMVPLWQRCRDLKVPMTIVAPVSRMPDISSLATRFRDLTVVIDHMADCPVDQPSELAKLLALAALPKVFVKISHTWSLSSQRFPWRDAHAQVERLAEAFGPSRLMWGSDWPVSLSRAAYGQTLDVVRNHLEFLNGSDRQWVLGQTAESVWGF